MTMLNIASTHGKYIACEQKEKQPLRGGLSKENFYLKERWKKCNYCILISYRYSMWYTEI